MNPRQEKSPQLSPKDFLLDTVLQSRCQAPGADGKEVSVASSFVVSSVQKPEAVGSWLCGPVF